MDAKNEMIRKGGTLLDACEVITVASVDGKGYPRPVPVVKLAAEGCGQIWFATGAGSRKTAQFRANPKAGVYSSATFTNPAKPMLSPFSACA